MKKKILSVFLVLAMCLTFVPTVAMALEPVGYVDGYGNALSSDSYTVVTASMTELGYGDFVVNADVTLPAGTIFGSMVNIIIMDGCTLTLTGGINCVDSGAAMVNIYVQSGGTGSVAGLDSIGEGCMVTLHGGTYLNAASGVLTADLLNVGAVYRSGTEGSYVYSSTAPAGADVTVVSCPHTGAEGTSAFGTDGKCAFCGISADYAWFTGKDPFGLGTVYEIREVGELVAFANLVNGTNLPEEITTRLGYSSYNFSGKTVKLMNNLNLSAEGNGISWVPIGGYAVDQTGVSRFCGTFDGNNKSITGLNVRGQNYAGLFGSVANGGTVKDLAVSGNVSGTYKVGGIVADTYNCTLSNCSFAGTVTGDTFRTGGIVGDGWHTTVERCRNSASVSGTGGDIGGIAGFLYSSSLKNCYNTGDVAKTATCDYTDNELGGIVGSLSLYGSTMITLERCYNTGIVSDTSTTPEGDEPDVLKIGGIVGSFCNDGNATVQYCYWLEGTADAAIGDATVGTDYSGEPYTANITNQVTTKTVDQFKSGETAWLLQDGQSTQVWGQELTDGDTRQNTPEISQNRVYRTLFTDSSGVSVTTVDTRYSNYGDTFTSLPVCAGTGFSGWQNAAGTKLTTATPVTKDDTYSAYYKGTLSATVFVQNYVRGDTPRMPIVRNNTGGGTASFYYNTANRNYGGTPWTQSTDLAPGTYYMYAEIAETEQYAAFTTPAAVFRVYEAEAKLTTLTAAGGTSSVTHYARIADAIGATAYVNANYGAEVTVLKNCTLPESGNTIRARDMTLNLNGFEVDGALNIDGSGIEVTINDSSTAKTGGITQAVTVKQGKLFVTGGNYSSLTVLSGADAELSGGKYTVKVENQNTGDSVLDLLAEGYGYKMVGNTALSWHMTPTAQVVTDNNYIYISVELIPNVGVTIAGDRTSAVYGQTMPTLTATVTGVTNNASVSYEWYCAATEQGVFSATPVGTGASTYAVPANTGAGTYYYGCKVTVDGYSARSNVLTVTVSKADPQYTAPTGIENLKYNGADQQLINSGTTAHGTMNYKFKQGTQVYTDATQLKGCAVDTYEIEWSITGDDNHNDAGPFTIQVDIGKAVPSLNVTIDGWKWGDEPNAPTVTGNTDNGAESFYYRKSSEADSEYTTQVPQDVGSYVVKAVVGETENCSEGSTTATFSISKADAPALSQLEVSQIYTATTGTADLSNIVGIPANAQGVSYTVGMLPSGVTGATLGADGKTLSYTLAEGGSVGDSFTIPVTVSSTNYASSQTGVKITLTAKTTRNLEVSMTDWQYGAEPNTPVYTPPQGATGAVVRYSGTGYPANAAAPENVGSYTVSVTCETATEIWSGTATFSITPKPLTAEMVTVTGSLTYNASEQTPTVQVKDGTTPLSSPDDYTLSVTPQKNAGQHTLSVTGTGNYSGTVSGIQWRIGEAQITPTQVTLQDKDYDGGTSAAVTAVTFSGTKGSDVLVEGEDFEVVSAAFGDKNVGIDKNVTVVVRLLNSDMAKNYQLSTDTVRGTASIERKLVVATIQVSDKDYDGNTSATVSAAVNSGLYPGDVLNVVGVTGTFETPGAGRDKRVNINVDSVSATGADSGNYEVHVPIRATGNINPATLTVTALDNTITYGEAPASNGVSITGFVNGENESVLTDERTYSFDYEQYGNVGNNYKINVSGFSAGNYTFNYMPGTLRVTEKTIDINWANTSLTYNSRAQKPTATAMGLVNNDECTLTVTGEQTAVGVDYTATVTALSNSNYSLPTDCSTTFSIGKAQQSITAADIEAVYGESNRSVVASGTVGNVSYAVTDGADVVGVDDQGGLTFLKAGDAVVTVTAAGNGSYEEGTVQVNITVVKATATVTALDISATVGDAVPDLSAPVQGEHYTVTNLVEGDSLQNSVVLTYETAPDMSGSGEWVIVPSVPEGDSRYDFTYVNGKLTVTSRNSGGFTQHTIKASAGAGGSISPAGNVPVLQGNDRAFTITPDKGFVVVDVTVDGESVGAVSSYTFKRVMGEHTIHVTFARQGGVFTDVPKGSYYEQAVLWAVEKGITGGVGNGLFAPDGKCTRAEIVTFLWREAGSPEPVSSEMPFTDVPKGSYYEQAVLWAVENGITGGVGNGLFDPDGKCTRAEIVTFLWRAAGSPEPVGREMPFTDVPKGSYYEKAVLWAVENGITGGVGNGLFDSNGECTRAQAVTFIYRAFNK